MPDYLKGKIYLIGSKNSNKKYFGSTTSSINTRYNAHLSAYKQFINNKACNKYASFEIFDLLDTYVKLVEEYPCNTRSELEKREQYYINNNKCNNKVIAFKNNSKNIYDYSKGKIYTLYSKKIDKYYIGSTIETLKKRFGRHISKYKLYINKKGPYYSSFEIIKNEDVEIKLLKYFPCSNKDELDKEEGNIIRQYIINNNCVNKNIAGRSHKDYYKENKDKVLDCKKKYRQKHKEYYQKKAQVTNLKTIKCECRFIGLKNHLKRHMKSINHKDKMKLLIL